MAEFGPLKGFGDQLAALETTLGANEALIAAFTDELQTMQITVGEVSTDVERLSRGISRGLRKAFDGLIFDGMKLSDALKTVASSMVGAAYNQAITPVTQHFGGLIAGAVGGLVDQVVPFAMSGGLGQAGAGQMAPSASTISPGGLGAAPQAKAPINVTMNISTPDVGGFERSRSQIAAEMSRALARGQRLR